MKLLAHPQTAIEVARFIANPGHALEVFGREGAGKTAVAEHIAARLLNAADINIHPYVLRLDVRTDKIGIDEIRNLQKELMLSVPGKGEVRRVVIIDHFDELGHEAQNAMLKTLEEPPLGTSLLFTVSRREQVLETIHSRAQDLTVRPIDISDARAQLSLANEADSVRAFRISDGDIGLLLALLAGDSSHPLMRAIDEAKNLLKGSRYDRLAAVDRITKAKDIAPISVVDALYRILDAQKDAFVSANNFSQLATAHKRLLLVQSALKDLDGGVSTKLALTQLFSQL